MKIALCDDQTAHIELLRPYVEEFFRISEIEAEIFEFFSGEEMIESNEKFDIVFLDMELGSLTGVDVAKNINKIALKHGGMPMTGFVCKSWEKGRFNDPYLRDSMMDFSVVTDTLECTVTWSNMAQVHRDVRKVCHALPNTVVTTHMSHCYPQGANLYFIFITKMNDEKAFKAYHTTILDAIQKSGAAISHHHGIGKMFAPWLEGYIGEKEIGRAHV